MLNKHSSINHHSVSIRNNGVRLLSAVHHWKISDNLSSKINSVKHVFSLLDAISASEEHLLISVAIQLRELDKHITTEIKKNKVKIKQEKRKDKPNTSEITRMLSENREMLRQSHEIKKLRNEIRRATALSRRNKRIASKHAS